jgi:hypothetical protein
MAGTRRKDGSLRPCARGRPQLWPRACQMATDLLTLEFGDHRWGLHHLQVRVGGGNAGEGGEGIDSAERVLP